MGSQENFRKGSMKVKTGSDIIPVRPGTQRFTCRWLQFNLQSWQDQFKHVCVAEDMHSLAFAICISPHLWKSLVRSWLAQSKCVGAYSLQFGFHCTQFSGVEPPSLCELNTWINVFFSSSQTSKQKYPRVRRKRRPAILQCCEPNKTPTCRCVDSASKVQVNHHTFRCQGSCMLFCVIRSALQVKRSQLLFQSQNSPRKVRGKSSF